MTTESPPAAAAEAAPSPVAPVAPSAVPIAVRRLRRVLLGLLLGFGVVIVLLLTMERPRPAPPHLAKLPPFTLTERREGPLTLDALRGKAVVASFFFTSCSGPCLLITERMKKVLARLPAGDSVRLLSITVDPATDDPKRLTAYAHERGADDPRWLFATGPMAAIDTLAQEGYKLAVQRGATAMDIAHAEKLVLVDPQGFVRGYYDIAGEAELERLLGDLRAVLP